MWRLTVQAKRNFIAEDEHGNDVLVGVGDEITEIKDAGPVEIREYKARMERTVGWNATFRFTPSHKLWTEIVTVDVMVLLRALE